MADIAVKIKDMNKTQKTAYLKTLTAEKRLEYLRFKNNERQKAYKADPDKKALANERSRLKMFVNRENKPEKYKELNKKHNQDYNKRLKQKAAEDKAKVTLSDAIKNMKARQKLNQLKTKKEVVDIVKDILNDMIDKAPNMKVVDGILKKKRGRKIK
jgi:hypothetical protein